MINSFNEILSENGYQVNYIEESLKLLKSKASIIIEGKLFDEIGGSSGLYKIVDHSLEKLKSFFDKDHLLVQNTEHVKLRMHKFLSLVINFEDGEK